MTPKLQFVWFFLCDLMSIVWMLCYTVKDPRVTVLCYTVSWPSLFILYFCVNAVLYSKRSSCDCAVLYSILTLPWRMQPISTTVCTWVYELSRKCVICCAIQPEITVWICCAIQMKFEWVYGSHLLLNRSHSLLVSKPIDCAKELKTLFCVQI